MSVSVYAHYTSLMYIQYLEFRPPANTHALFTVQFLYVPYQWKAVFWAPAQVQ